jgi:hypothetical protein
LLQRDRGHRFALQLIYLTSDSPFSLLDLLCALLIQNGANVCAVQRPVSGSNRCIAERIRANFSARFAYPAPVLVFLPLIAVDLICECLFHHCHLSEASPGLGNQESHTSNNEQCHVSTIQQPWASDL